MPPDEGLPVELRTVRTRPLFVMRLDEKGPLLVGGTSNGFRRTGIVPGGSFKGAPGATGVAPQQAAPARPCGDGS